MAERAERAMGCPSSAVGREERSSARCQDAKGEREDERTKRLNGVFGGEESIEILFDVLGVEVGCKEVSKSVS